MTLGLLTDEHGRTRCGWPKSDPLYVAYHDDEWGRPVRDDRRLFEKLCLEGCWVREAVERERASFERP